MNTKLILFSFICLLCGCRQAVTPSEDVREIIVFQGETIDDLSSKIQSVEVIRLDHPNDLLFNDNPDVRCCDSTFYILDRYGSQLIYRFNGRGQLLDSIGQIGRGPQEYSNPNAFYIEEDRDELCLSYPPDFNLCYYRKNGDFIRKQRSTALQCQGFTKIMDHFWVYCGYNTGRLERVVQTDSALQVTDSILPLKTNVFNLVDGASFSGGLESVYLREPLTTSVFKVYPDTLREAFRFDFGDRNMPERLWATSDPMSVLDEITQKGYVQTRSFYSNGRSVVAEFSNQMAAFGETKNMRYTYFCALKSEPSSTWEWMVKETGDLLNDPYPWHAAKIKGFTKDGRLMLFLFGHQMEEVKRDGKVLITNPEAISQIDTEMDMFILLCDLKK